MLTWRIHVHGTRLLKKKEISQTLFLYHNQTIFRI